MDRKLHSEKFEELVALRGRKVNWSEAIICSCWNLTSGQPSYTCKACNSTGYIYKPPIVCQALLTSIAFNKDFNEFAGAFEVGDATLTVPKMVPQIINGRASSTEKDLNPMFRIGVFDLITVIDDDWKFSEVLIRNRATPKRPADTLLNFDITTIHSIQTSDQITGAVTYYNEGTDFTMSGNLVVWTPGGNSPADGQQYGIVYGHRPTYTVLIQLPEPRHQDSQDLPKRVVLRFKSGGFTKVDNG